MSNRKRILRYIMNRCKQTQVEERKRNRSSKWQVRFRKRKVHGTVVPQEGFSVFINIPLVQKQDLEVLADTLVCQRFAEGARVVSQGIVLSGVDEGICSCGECWELTVAVLDELGYDVVINRDFI